MSDTCTTESLSGEVTYLLIRKRSVVQLGVSPRRLTCSFSWRPEDLKNIVSFPKHTHTPINWSFYVLSPTSNFLHQFFWRVTSWRYHGHHLICCNFENDSYNNKTVELKYYSAYIGSTWETYWVIHNKELETYWT